MRITLIQQIMPLNNSQNSPTIKRAAAIVFFVLIVFLFDKLLFIVVPVVFKTRATAVGPRLGVAAIYRPYLTVIPVDYFTYNYHELSIN